MIALVVLVLSAPFLLLWGIESVHPLARQLGMTDGSGQPYLFWSGFFSDATIFTAAVIFAAHHNCHARWCWRIGRHAVDGSPYVVCRRHHPEHAGMPHRPTAAFLSQLHREVRDPWPGA